MPNMHVHFACLSKTRNNWITQFGSASWNPKFNGSHFGLPPSSIIGSAEALPILCVRYFRWERERERDTDRERERRKWRHHCRAKIGDEFVLSLAKNSHNWRWAYTSLAKNSHFSFLPSHFPSLPSRRGHVCGAEISNEFTLSIAKKCFALLVPPLSNGTSRATSDRKPETNDQILPSPILFFPSKKWIKLIPKTIGNRKEIVCEVARGDKPYLRKSTDRKAQIRKAFVQFSGLICALRSVDFLR